MEGHYPSHLKKGCCKGQITLTVTKVADWRQAIDLTASAGADLVESRRNSLPERLRPGLSVSAGHAYVTMSEYQLHTIQRHGSVEQRGWICVAQSVLQVGS